MNHTLAATAAAIIGVHAVCGAAAAQPIPRYTIQILAPVPGDPSDGSMTAISAATPDGATIVGFVERPGGVRDAFAWWNGVAEALPTLPGRTRTEALGINAAGTIVGLAGFGFGNEATPAIWTAGQVGVLAMPTGASGYAAAINDSGRIVGTTRIGPQGPARPMLWDGGQPIDLGVLPGHIGGQAFRINNAGLILGHSWDGGPRYRPVVWSNGAVSELPLPAGAEGFSLGDINDAGRTVGSYLTSGFEQRAYLWIDGVGVELPGLGGGSPEGAVAIDINNSGDIVGTSSSPSGFAPVLWRSGVAYDLRDWVEPIDGVRLIGAHRITDDGIILGSAVIDGLHTAITLAPVPTPASLVLLGSGMLLAVGRRGRSPRAAAAQAL